jgi:flagellar assembly protein FliH
MSDPRPSRIRTEPGELRRAFRPPPTGDAGPDPVAAAFERGRAQGKIEGRDEATAEYVRQAEALHGEVARSLKHMADLEESLTHRHRQALIDLALEIASRLVRQRIEAGDPVAARVLSDALDAIPVGEPIRARVHPDDIAAIRHELDELLERRRIDVAADEEVGRGGCIVEAPGGTVDASFATALEVLREAAEGHG